MMAIYLSHPFSKNPEENRKSAENVTAALSKKFDKKFIFINPLALFQGQSHVLDDDTILRQAVEVMQRCDGVIFCSGWQKSRGCRLEHYIAHKNGIPLWIGPDAFASWLQSVSYYRKD